MSKPVPTADRIAVLDLLIVEHRERRNAAADRLVSIQTTIGAVATGVVAVVALAAPRLPYGSFTTANTVLLGLSALAALGVLLSWVDALGGPTKGVLAAHRKAAEKAAANYERARATMEPLAVREALLRRLIAEDALAQRTLKPREESLQIAAWLSVTALVFFTTLGASLVL